MPAGSEWKKRWWTLKTTLEKFLLAVVLLAVIIIIILLVLVVRKQTTHPETCDTSICLREAAKIAEYVDPSVNPCEDFYQFACGNFLKHTHGNEKLELSHVITEKHKWQLIEAYSEPIKGNDHKMVQAVKKLFAACMNKDEIEYENLQTMKETLKLLGGWPVVEENRWNATNFNWLNTTYKLREMGYYYKVFLELSVETDPANGNKYIYKVKTPSMWDYSSYNFDKNKFMVDVAIRFGAAQYDTKVDKAMRDALQFLTQLQKEAHARYSTTFHRKYTIEQYQQLYGAIDWLQFINTLAGPDARITKDEFVLFPPPETLRNWLNIISKTSKRVQADYLIWKVIEETIQFLTADLQIPNLRATESGSRYDFCLLEIQKRFIPSPVEIVCDRKYLPNEKKKQIEGMAESIKSQLIKAMKNVDWMDKTDKQNTIDEILAIKVVIEHMDDFFTDKILDQLDVDMITVKDDTLLNLIAQAERNYQTTFYKRVKQSDNFYGTLYPRRLISAASYYANYGILLIPRTLIGEDFFNDNRPAYLNYAAMGTKLGSQFHFVLGRNLQPYRPDIWSNYTTEAAKSKLVCLKNEVQDYGTFSETEIGHVIPLPLIVGETLAYATYEEWLRDNKDELQLVDTSYTPKQIFWITVASTYCRPTSKYSLSGRVSTYYQQIAKMTSAALRNHPQLAKDFGCPAGSKMNPSKKCKVI